jgi:hypothetical protein
MSNSIITAGWLFIAGWSAVVATLSGIAFGRDLFPEKIHTSPPRETSSDIPRERRNLSALSAEVAKSSYR